MKPLLSLTAAALLGTSAHADWLLSDYATVTADTSKTNEMYGVQTFSNAASTTKVTVPVAGSLKVEATFASTGTEGYTANLGLLHPIKPDWAATDLTGLTSIDFDIKTSIKPTDGWEFSFGSKEYGDLATAGTVLSTAFPVATAGAWVHVSITPDMLAYPSWFCDDVAKPCPAITLAQVLAATDNIQIAPKTKYKSAGSQNGTPCTACVGPTTTAVTFEIKNITLKPFYINRPPNPLGLGCTDQTKMVVLDDFVDGDTQNEQGGYWYAFSDTNAAATSADSANGSSQATAAYTDGAVLTATLDKRIGVEWHKYAGWATLGTEFADKGTVDLKDVTGIGFKVTASPTFSSKVGLNFKVQAAGIADDRPHMVAIPLSLMTGSTEICVRWQDLKQASWVAPKQVLDSTNIQKLSWELKILDQRDPAIHVAEAAIQLDDVILYGTNTMPVSKTDAIRGAAVRKVNSLSYAQGMLTVRGLEGYRSLEVVSVNGTRIGNYALGGRAETSLRLDLRAGAYFVVARDGLGNRLIQSLAVVR